MGTKGMRPVVLSVVLSALMGLVLAAEPPKPEPKPPAKPEGEAKPPEPKPAPPKEDIAAKVDDIFITRIDLEAARRLAALNNPQVTLNNRQIVDQLITRVLWSRHLEKSNLRPSAADIQQAVARLDAQLRQRGITYENFLNATGIPAEVHLAAVGYDLAMQQLVESIQAKLKPEEIKAEFDAHTDWYDGSRIRLSMIFVDTSGVANDPKELEKRKERVEKVHAQLIAGKDFDLMARDYSDGAASGTGGDRGWFARKGADVDEPLLAATWTLKVGDFTKPMQGPRGWHILKVADRESAYFTFQGAKRTVINELTRRRLDALLEELRAAAKIETYL